MLVVGFLKNLIFFFFFFAVGSFFFGHTAQHMGSQCSNQGLSQGSQQ